ncbi:MAG: hypothetical protein IJQ10_01800 [Clostridia bacterium]|nr:hypothetical protein [Clostridia bacterium]
MKQTLTFTDIGQRKFNTIISGIIDISNDKSKFESFSKLKSMDEAFDFLQVFYPGDYTKDDFAKFLLIIMANIYYRSKDFARYELFELTLADIKKRTGTDFKKYLQNFSKTKSKKLSDDDVNIAGGVGDRKLSKIIAGSMAFLVPVSMASNHVPSVQAMGLTLSRGQSKTKTKSSGGVWNWIKEHWKPIAAVVGVAAAGITAFATYKRVQSAKKYQEAANEYNKDKEGNEKVSTSFWDYFRPGSKARDDLESKKVKAEEKKKMKEEKDKIISAIKEDRKDGEIVGGKRQLISSTVEMIQKFGKKYKLGDFKGKNIEEADQFISGAEEKAQFGTATDEDKKKEHEGIVKDSDKVGASNVIPGLAVLIAGGKGLWEFGKSIFDGIANLSKKAGDIVELPSKVLSLQERFISIFGHDRVESYYDDEEKLFQTAFIEEGLNSIIKGQKTQMRQLASILAAFNVKARMASTSSESQSFMDSSQLNSKCVFLTGPSGTGKSMLTSLVPRFTAWNIGHLTINLNQYDGKTDVNTYLSKQEEFKNSARYLGGKYVVINIEEIDKVCKDPVIREKVNQWLHSVYDTGKIGGGEKESPVTVAAALFLMTSNELPSTDILINGKVKGLNIKAGEQKIESSNENNYIDVLRALSKNTSRELPIERTGALISRSEVIEFNQTSDESMEEIIDMHIKELNLRFLSNEMNMPIKINYSDKFKEKLARLRHSVKYKDGGSRTLINDILNAVLSGVVAKFNSISNNDQYSIETDKQGNVVEDNLAQLWLDYTGLDKSGLHIAIRDKEEEAGNNGEEPDMVEEELNANRKPEVEKFIQKLMNDELNKIVGSLSTAYNSGVVKDWNSILSQKSKSVIKSLSSLVSSYVENSSVDNQIKVLVDKRNELTDLMSKRGILDDEWEALKELRDVVNAKTSGAVAAKRNNEKSKVSLSSLKEVVDEIEKIAPLASSIKQYDLFAANNKNSLSRIFEMLSDNGFRQFSDESNMTATAKLNELIKNKDLIKSLEPDLKDKQHIAIKNFKDSVQKQIAAIKSEVENRANEIDEIFSDIKEAKINSSVASYKSILSQTDSEFLKSLVSMVSPDTSISDIDKQLDFVLEHKSEIKSELLSIGTTDEQLGNAKSLKFKIQQNSKINDVKEEVKEEAKEEVKEENKEVNMEVNKESEEKKEVNKDSDEKVKNKINEANEEDGG